MYFNFKRNTKRMDFKNPRLYINEYYNEKKNIIDYNCEYAILNCKGDENEQKKLHDMRMNMINRIDSVKLSVLNRHNLLKSKYTDEMLFQNNIKEIRDEIFSDQYCIVLDIYGSIPFFEFKIGVLLFSQYDDDLLQDLR